MLRSLSTRAIALVAALFALVAALGVVALGGHAAAARTTDGRHGVPPPPHPPDLLVPIEEAVRRSVADGPVRIRLEIRHATDPTGHIHVSGIAALATDDVDLVLHAEGRPGGPAHLRIVGDEAWLGSDDLPMQPVPAANVRGSAATSFHTLLGRLRADRRGTGATLAGQPATVELDDRGRITHVQVRKAGGTFDLHLDGYDEDLALVPPP